MLLKEKAGERAPIEPFAALVRTSGVDLGLDMALGSKKSSSSMTPVLEGDKGMTAGVAKVVAEWLGSIGPAGLSGLAAMGAETIGARAEDVPDTGGNTNASILKGAALNEKRS